MKDPMNRHDNPYRTEVGLALVALHAVAWSVIALLSVTVFILLTLLGVV